MSSYQPNIPTGTVDLDQDYLNLQGNFQQINTTYLQDHIPLTDVANNGYHKAIHMVQQAAPVAVASVGELYCTTNNDGFNNTESLFYRSGTFDLNIRMTRNFVPVMASTGRTFLPGGLILQWGTQASTGGLQTLNFPVAFPTNFFNFQATMIRNSSNVDVIYGVTPATAGNVPSIQYRDTSSGNSFFWWAIGN